MKKKTTVCMAAIMMASAAFTATARDGVRIDFLGNNNTLVRVNADQRYLILPCEESNGDARINVLVDGKIADTFYVRLATGKTDYTVPYDLTPYEGKKVVFDIVTPQGRSSVREAKNDVCWKNITLSDTFDTSNREKYRPAFHHTPLWGWMNDPNGMFYKDGKWHLYYQHNPYGSKWQNMTWGHSVSDDLVSWNHMPEAIRPDGLGSIFSGSCVIDENNTAGFGNDAVLAMYTACGTNQMQSLASSHDDGITFAKFEGNPTLTLESEARDPNMFWNPEAGLWTLSLAHALDHEILFFTSPDMKEWTLTGQFGKGIACQDGVWECPDLFKLPLDGEEKWVLICNINPGGPFGGSATQYFVGDFDGKTFKADLDASGEIDTKWMDYGKDHYATVSFYNAPEDRRTVIGWMSNWQYAADVPTMQFRSANTLPREVSLFRGADGNAYLASAPSPEVDALRDRLVRKAGGMGLGKSVRTFALPAGDGLCEISMDIDAAKAREVNLTLSNKEGDLVTMAYDAKARTFAVDRTKSGIVDFSENFPAVTVAPTREDKGKVSLRIFVDRSSIEVFGNDGRFVLTNLAFPHTPYTTLSLSSKGGKAQVSNLKIYSLKAQ